MGPMQQASLGPILSLNHVSEPSMPKPSCQKSRKTIITQNILVTQSSNIVHCDQHTQKPNVQIFKPFCTLFPVQIDILGHLL